MTFFDDEDDIKYYAQGVSITTAILPEGGRERMGEFSTPGTRPGRVLSQRLADLPADPRSIDRIAAWLNSSRP